MILIMNKVEKIITNDTADFYLQQCLKNWAADQHPPKEVRSKLLHAASPFYFKIFNGSPIPGEANKAIAALIPYRSPLNRRTDIHGQTQLWAWHMTMTTLRFFA